MTSILTLSNLLVSLQILVVVYITWYYYKYFTRKSPLPGPFPLPLIGNLHQVGMNPLKYISGHHKTFGDMFEIWVGSKRFVVLSNPSYVEQLYSPNLTNTFFPRLNVPLFDETGMDLGVAFNGHYKSWKRNRRIIVQSLMSPKFHRQFVHLTQSLFNENEKFWSKEKNHFDLAKWVKCFVTDLALQTITNKPFYCLTAHTFGEKSDDPIRSEEIKRSIKFSQALDMFFINLTFQTFMPDKLKKYFPGISNFNRKIQNELDWLNKSMHEIIKERRKEIENTSENIPTKENGGSNLIDVLLTMKDDEAPITDEEIRANLVEVAVGGSDTTAHTFCFTIWQLAHHPEVLARLRSEIREVLDDDESRKITFDDLEKFKYLDAIIKETLRIMPVAPLLPRTSTQEGVIGGKYFEADTIFLITVDLIHKLSKNWKNPDQFIPDRFLDQPDNKVFRDTYIPFGGGIRICPGKNMAMLELKTLLISIYRKYDVELVDKTSEEPKVHFRFINYCTELKAILRPRN